VADPHLDLLVAALLGRRPLLGLRLRRADVEVAALGHEDGPERAARGGPAVHLDLIDPGLAVLPGRGRGHEQDGGEGGGGGDERAEVHQLFTLSFRRTRAFGRL